MATSNKVCKINGALQLPCPPLENSTSEPFKCLGKPIDIVEVQCLHWAFVSGSMLINVLYFRINLVTETSEAHTLRRRVAELKHVIHCCEMPCSALS